MRMTGTASALLTALVAIAILPPSYVFGQQIEARQQYVYVLQVAPRFHNEATWTETEQAVVAQHFERLAQAVKSGQVILAGRTNESLDTTFGLVIFEADSEAAAREFMQSDPAVIAGLMTATLHPYSIALQRK
jgi:uncharacterized protein YciI